MKHNVPIQSLIDHIKTAIDIDPWAKEMAEDLLKEQEVKTGKWIPVTNGRGGMECSICHDYAPSYQNGAEYLSKYCPNCGAKMERSVKWE